MGRNEGMFLSFMKTERCKEQYLLLPRTNPKSTFVELNEKGRQKPFLPLHPTCFTKGSGK